MPDEAKHEALARLGFSVARTCATCKHWAGPMTPIPRPKWGKCTLAPYVHAKHTHRRLAGTPAVGTCDSYESMDGELEDLVGPDYSLRYLGAT